MATSRPELNYDPNGEWKPSSQAQRLLASYLAMLSDVYGQLTPPAVTAFVLALGDLTEREMDTGFKYTLKHHKTGFRPTPGEILEYLRVARESAPLPHRPQLMAPELTPEQRAETEKNIIEMKRRIGLLPSMPEPLPDRKVDARRRELLNQAEQVKSKVGG